jgi:flagellin-specific chaperone FliS
MLALRDPNEAYRRSQFDARIAGASAADLVRVCVAEVVDSLALAILAHRQRNYQLRSHALTRAVTALTALEMGIDRQAPLAAALLQFYGSARIRVLDCAIRFDTPALEEVRSDFTDLRAAFA